jgi:2-polyprenyl-3-methyl-5-hydroxy-6-metoxy-1,4-benzoquinol methylase
MTTTHLLPHRSDARLAQEVTQKVLLRLPGVSSVVDIGCGDGVVGTLLPESCGYRGIDLSNASIYKKNSSDKRISYSPPEQLAQVLSSTEPADAVLLLDVLEHTRKFTELFEQVIPLAKRYLIVSLPNELFVLDRLRMLAGREHAAHSLDLIHMPEGFKHQYVINIQKARNILSTIGCKYNLSLDEEWQRPLIAKNSLSQPLLWTMRQISSSQLWSMGNVFVFKKEP